jgi:hypothetical protein
MRNKKCLFKYSTYGQKIAPVEVLAVEAEGGGLGIKEIKDVFERGPS